MSHSRVVHSKTTRPTRLRQQGQSRSKQQTGVPAPVPRPGSGTHEHRLGSGSENQVREGSGNVRDPGGRTVESYHSHYVVSPDPSKNSKLKSTARHEEEQYRQHKEVQRERTADMLRQQRPQAVGGSALSRDEITERRKREEKEQQMEARFAPVRQRQKREEYQKEKRHKEEEGLQQMKRTQREKAERLAAKQEIQQQADMEEMRRKRLARFDT